MGLKTFYYCLAIHIDNKTHSMFWCCGLVSGCVQVNNSAYFTAGAKIRPFGYMPNYEDYTYGGLGMPL
jgi:hypothetical protein